jgi:hypothetical protein
LLQNSTHDISQTKIVSRRRRRRRRTGRRRKRKEEGGGGKERRGRRRKRKKREEEEEKEEEEKKKMMMKEGAPVILQNSGLAGQQIDSHTFRTASAVDRLSAVATRDNTHSRYILGW